MARIPPHRKVAVARTPDHAPADLKRSSGHGGPGLADHAGAAVSGGLVTQRRLGPELFTLLAGGLGLGGVRALSTSPGPAPCAFHVIHQSSTEALRPAGPEARAR